MKLSVISINLQTNLLIFLLALSITTPQACSQFHFADWYCFDNVGNYTTLSTYRNNLFSLFPIITNQASLSGFNTSSFGEGIHRVFMLYNCRGDLTSQQCHDCVKEASQEVIERCPSQKEAILWYEECMIRYAQVAIITIEEESPYTWGYSTTVTDNDGGPDLPKIVAENIGGLIEEVAYNRSRGGFVTGQANLAPNGDAIYLLVQCNADFLGTLCENCLRSALKRVDEFGGMAKSTPLMMFFPSCHIRYDLNPVLLNEANYPPSSSLMTVSDI